MSDASATADAFISSHREEALSLGERLAGLIDDPEVFISTLLEGLRSLFDPAYAATVERVSPGTGSDLSVRGPLIGLSQRGLRRGLRESSSASALSLAQRLSQAGQREVRTFALPCLERSLAEEPERTWQELRRLGRGARDWIEVDGLAGVWASGVLAEPFRWAELEQLVYSTQAMERRIVGAALACMPHALPTARRGSLIGKTSEQSYRTISMLIGDAEPMVQKSLSWAIREWTRVDAAGTEALLRSETAIAVDIQDGHRAWVIRDALSNAEPELREELRGRLAGLRRRADAPSTSVADAQAAAFAPLVAAADGAVARQGDRYTRSHA